MAAPDPDTPGLIMHWIVTAPDVLPKPRNEAALIGRVIHEAMAIWVNALRESDAREIVRGYAAQKNCAVTKESDRRLRINSPSQGHIFIDFDDSGKIHGIEFPPESKPVSWFNGLFQRKA